MKLADIFEANVVNFPLDRRGLIQDEITGQWIPDPALNPQEPEFWVVDDRYVYSRHPTEREANLATKKMKLKGKQVWVHPV